MGFLDTIKNLTKPYDDDEEELDGYSPRTPVIQSI